MASHWPTDLDADGTAPVNIRLVASGDEHLMRQAMYQLQAATQLQDRGFKIEAFQLAVVGKMVRITVPIAALTPTGEKAAVYTQSEEWTPERVTDLRAWVANLREESDVAIVVASRLPHPDAARVPGVAEWLHLPYDTLNKPTTPEPARSEPLLPCLKEAKWQGRETTVCRALWEKQASQYMPWVAVGYDFPNTFEFINTDRLRGLNTTEQALEAQALANLRARPAAWKPMEVDIQGRKLRMLMCSGDYFAAEHILDAAFMQQAQRTLKADGLFVGIPRRGLLMATPAGQDHEMIGAFGAAVAGQFSRGESALISPMLFAMKDGAIVGLIEAVAEAVVPDGEPEGPPEEQDEDDPDAPYVTAMVTRNDRGTEDVHLMAGGEDGDRLAKAIESGFMALLKEHMLRQEFSGHIQIVVLGMTPPAARKQIPSLVEHLRGACNELSRGSDKCYRVSLTFQRDSLHATSDAPAAAATPPRVDVAGPAPAPKPRRAWTRRMLWVILAAGAALVRAYFAFDHQAPAQARAQAYPNTVNYQGAQLTQATKWDRGDTSGAVYVRAGEALPAASLQLGVIVSTEHPTANDLLAWVREQAARSGGQRYHDSGAGNETCVVGMSRAPTARRTYMALQLCRTGDARAACVESDRELDGGVFGECLNKAGCFDEVCDRRWMEEGDDLELALAGFLAGAIDEKQLKVERRAADRDRAELLNSRAADARARLASDRQMTQCDAALELGRLGAREYAPALRDLLPTSSAAAGNSVRGCAAAALVDLGEVDAALAAYTAWIAGSDPDLYRSAIMGFGSIGPRAAPIAVPFLEEALQSSNANVRLLAADSLSKIRPGTK